jgi:integrase
MASIRERIDATGKKSYHVQIRIQGFPPQTKTFDSKTIAKQWAAHVESELRAGRYLPRIEAQRHTVRELLEKYRDEVLIPRKPQRVRDQGPQLQWWIDKLGSYSLADLTPALIGKYRDDLITTRFGKNKARTPATVVRYLAVLSHALSTAVKEWGWLPESPMFKVAKPKVDNERVRYLTDEERERLLAATKMSANRHLHIIVLTAISTGMRYSEIMHLRWRQILLNENEHYGLVLLEHTKNGERRGVPLTGPLLAEYRQLKAAHQAQSSKESAGDDVLLFASEGDPERPVEIRKAWETALGRAKVSNFRFHDLRHTTASYLAMEGASAPEIAEVLGHKDLKMVKRYSHFGKGHIAKVLSRMHDSRLGKSERIASTAEEGKDHGNDPHA